MRKTKLFKVATAAIMALAIGMSMTGCSLPFAKGDNDTEELLFEPGEVDIIASTEAAEPIVDDGAPWNITSDSAIEIYNKIRENMHDYVAAIDSIQDEYVGYDYMYFDYDQDGEKEVILYLRYFVTLEDDKQQEMLDLVFLDYDAESKSVYIKAINTGDVDDSCFYGDYKEGTLARYSWSINPNESYMYSVQFNEEGSLIYVLEEGYDEIISEFEKIDIVPLPVYGEWEMILNDM